MSPASGFVGTSALWPISPAAVQRSPAREGPVVEVRKSPVAIAGSGCWSGESGCSPEESGSRSEEAERPTTPPPRHQVTCPGPLPGPLVQLSGPSKFHRLLLEAPGSWSVESGCCSGGSGCSPEESGSRSEEAERPPTPPPRHQVKCPSPLPGPLVQLSGPSKFHRLLLEAPGSWSVESGAAQWLFRRVRMRSRAGGSSEKSGRSSSRMGPVYRRPCPPPPAPPAAPP